MATALVHRPSGLVVPTKQELPKRQCGPLEVHGDEQREATKDALMALWHAAELGRSSGIIFPGDQPQKVSQQRELWRFIGRMLLGEDAREPEIKT